MNTTLWIIQGILAVMFATAGIMKSIRPMDKLVKSGLNWVERMPLFTVRFIGLSEFLGAIGLILPMAVNIYPVLTAISACGLALIMLLAIFHHAKYKEHKSIVFNIVLLAFAIFVACGRFITL